MESADTLSHDNAVLLGRDKALLHLSLVEVGNVLLSVQERINKVLVCLCEGIVYNFTGNLIVLRKISVKFESVVLYSLVAVLLNILDDLGREEEP